MEFIHTENAPNPAGHYSQAVKSGGMIFVSGQLPIHPADGNIPAGIEEQARQVLENLEQILLASGSSVDKVVKATVYISDISLWGTFNQIYAEKFGSHKPARAVVPTRDLHHGCLVEVEAVAESGDSIK
jgi:2-iminobutanoate/2-iminopropanoate deaminase